MNIQPIATATASVLVAFLLSSCVKCLSLDCGENGNCTEGICVCDPGYYGENCHRSDSCYTRQLDCKHNGTCLDGQCECQNDYFGLECETLCANGSYENDTCVCDLGYEGETCEDLIRDRYLGNYNASESCTNGNYTYTINIQADVGPTNILIHNMYDLFVNPVPARIIDFDSIVIDYIEPDFDKNEGISGSGALYNGQIHLQYTVSDGQSSNICTGTFNKL